MSFFPNELIRECKKHEIVCEDKYIGGGGKEVLDQAWNDTSLGLILYTTYQPHATPSSHAVKYLARKKMKTDVGDKLVSLLYQQR